MLKNNISIVLISERKGSSRHLGFPSVLFSFVCFAIITFLSGVWLYSYVLTDRSAAMNSVSEPGEHQVPALACESGEKDDQESKEDLVKKEKTERIKLNENVKKIQKIEEKLIYMEKFLEKKGINKDLSMGGLYLPSDDPGRLSGEYLDLISKRTEDTIRILRTYPIGSPVDSSVSSEYGYRIDPFKKKRAFHSGTDFYGSVGDIVKTTADGVVERAGYYGGYGKCVVVKHKNGFKTLYAHLSKVKVVKGQKVSSGDEIGKVGSTGRSTGPHLHYEIIKNGKKINPKKYIEQG